MCDAQPYSQGFLQAASCNTQGASDETQFFNEFLKRSGKAEHPFKCLTKATIIQKMGYSGYNAEFENDIYVDIGGDTYDAVNGLGICDDLILPIKTAALALCEATPSCSQSHVNKWMSCVPLHSGMYRISSKYNKGCDDMKKELQLLSLPGIPTSTTTATATAPAATPASTISSTTTATNPDADASTTTETDGGSSTPPLSSTTAAATNIPNTPAISPESNALAPLTTTPQPVAAGSSKGSGVGTAAAVLGVLLLLAVVACAAVLHCTRQQAEYQHGQADAVHNPVYIVDINAANHRRNSVVATDSNQQQFLVPMEADNTSDGDGDGDGDGAAGASAGGSAPPSPEYLVAVTHNEDYTSVPPIPEPTPRQGMPANAAAAADGTNAYDMPAKDADGYVVDEYTAKDGGGLVADVHVEKDADGYVVDDFTPDGGGGGDPIVYATYDASAGAAVNVEAVYSVPASEGGTTEVYAPATAGIESNA